MGERIFYLTAKTVTRQVAEQTIKIMMDKGLIFRSITLTSRERSCFMDTLSCNPEQCSYARGHYDRLNQALKDILQLEGLLTREIVLEYAKKHHVCPFEFSLDIALWADCIICDYNHVFDPRAFSGVSLIQGDYILLVDEAHNRQKEPEKWFCRDF